jgi:alcohol dehydrogenase class IV
MTGTTMEPDPAQLRGTWHFPTTIWFGAGKISLLARAGFELGMSRPLLVTDPGLASTPMIEDAIDANGEAGLPTTLFSAIKPNPTGRNIADGVAALRAHGCDGVIAFGGGSALDAGKTIALVGAQRPEGVGLWGFEDGRKDWRNAEPPLPVVGVPTTAGTGSETGRAAVVVDEAAQRKVIVSHPAMMPKIVIADPALTVGLPANLTAWTGMDALAHCLEAWCSPLHNPFCDGIALEGMRLVAEFLPRAVADGGDLAARAQMLAAASMGSTAFQKGLGAIHAMSHPIGANYDTHHGLTNAVVMPYVLVFNRPAVEEKLARLAAYLGLPADRGSGFDSVLDWVLGLRDRFAIPHTLADLGVRTDDLDALAEAAAQDPTAASNPVPLDVAALRTLFGHAWSGALAR